MLTKTITSIAVLSTTVVGKPEASYHPPYASEGYPYYYQRVSFPEPKPLIDPLYYADMFSKFKGCKAKKCIKEASSYSDDISESIAQLGEYTSCVTGCAAEQLFEAISDYKYFLGKVFEVGTYRLGKTRDYLSGKDEYDVIGEATRIDDSCCLPTDYFTPWDKILIPAKVMTKSSIRDIIEQLSLDSDYEVPSRSVDRMISVTTYLDSCTDVPSDRAEGLNKFIKVACNTLWVEYLELMQRNIGHLIMAPKTKKLAPPNKCVKDESALGNPRAVEFGGDICVASECVENGKKMKIDTPLVKDIIPAQYTLDACPSDFVVEDGGERIFEMKYVRLDREYVDFYTLLGGLPSELQKTGESSPSTHSEFFNVHYGGYAAYECKFDLGLAKVSGNYFTDSDSGVTEEAIEAAKACPFGGLFEYCSMQQYASYLQKQLFDDSACPISSMQNEIADTPESLHTLACLYKTISMKCDCMEAVLNCYEHQFTFQDAMAGTIGKAASILCGFILCLRPKVYSLFGGQHAIEQANIMRELLLQVGVSVPQGTSMPPATFSFLAFGIGMIAFVATKIVSKRTRTMHKDEGYAQLI